MATADLHLVRRLPTADEYLSLRASVGWRVPPAADAARALENSLFGVCATDVGDTVAMARVIGDGAFYFYIQDLVVEPSYQGRGLGRSIVDDIERRIVDRRTNTRPPSSSSCPSWKAAASGELPCR